ncbi:MAG: peptidylprolyl isomerase [Leptolyngbyaceae cyanobacterium]
MIHWRGIDIQEDDILFRLKKELGLKDVCTQVVRQQIIDRVAQENNLAVTDEEIQAEADRLRYAKRLFHIKDTYAWLADQLITADDWEAGIRDHLRAEKLAKHLFPKEAIEKFFAERKLDFDQVLLYRIVVPYPKLAQEISYAIQEDEISFYEAAHLYDIDQKRRHTCGYEGLFYRWSLKPDISAIVFGSEPGEVIGPLDIDQSSHLLMVEEFIPTVLTPERYQEIQNRLFDEWLTTELNFSVSNANV